MPPKKIARHNPEPFGSSAPSARSLGSRSKTNGARKATAKQNSFIPGFEGFNAATQTTSVSQAQLMSLQNLFETHPVLLSATSVLEARLLSKGPILMRNGQAVECSPEFQVHLDTHWMQFAREALRHFLIAGFCVAHYDTEPEDCATTRYERLHRNSHETQLRRIAERQFGRRIVPYIAPFSLYLLSWRVERYRRIYRVAHLGVDASVLLASGADDLSEDMTSNTVLHIAEAPDHSGNVNSPMASVHMISAFVDDLVEQAAVAERNRAQPALVTQVRAEKKADGVRPSDMFFDSESREISNAQTVDEDAMRARALQLQLQLCSLLNDANRARGGPASGVGGGASASLPQHEMITGRLFTLPHDQEVAPQMPRPEARGDLEGLLRLAWENMSIAIGVPASLLFESRFASRTSAQLALLNSRVKQLGMHLDRVLTSAFLDIYSDYGQSPEEDDGQSGESPKIVNDVRAEHGEARVSVEGLEGLFATNSTGQRLEGGQQGKATNYFEDSSRGRSQKNKNTKGVFDYQLILSITPLAATEEVMALFQSGIADWDSAGPLALNAIGLNVDEIAQATKRHQLQADLAEKERLEDRKLALSMAREQATQAAINGSISKPNEKAGGRGAGGTEDR